MTAWDSWIGNRHIVSATLDPAQANRMAATLDREPTFIAGDDLAPGFHWLYFHDILPHHGWGTTVTQRSV